MVQDHLQTGSLLSSLCKIMEMKESMCRVFVFYGIKSDRREVRFQREGRILGDLGTTEDPLSCQRQLTEGEFSQGKKLYTQAE